jgi:hypothetical protein
MNYRIILRDTFRLFRESKLLWILGVISFFSEVIFRGSIYSIGNPPVPCIAYPLFFISFYFSFVANCSLIYSANQIVSEQKPTYSEAWRFSKTKLRRILWLYFLSIPLVIFAIFLVGIVLLSEISTSLTWLMDVLVTLLLGSVFTLSICTIVSHNLEAGLALWTGLSIVVNNFFHIVILNSIFLILRLAVNIAVGNSLLGVFFIVPLTVTMTLAYRVFITKGSYPALSNIQPTA